MAVSGANTTCDIYRSGNAPPAAPDVPGVSCVLVAKGQSSLTTLYYTHVLLVSATTDIRDNFSSTFTPGPSCDTVYVPDRNGTQFQVLLVRRKGRGTGGDVKEALLLRTGVTYPTNDL
jgi:hypothetical protein